MSKERSAEIERLAAVVYEKRQRFRMLSMTNTFNLTAAEALQQTQAYEVARAEMWKAESELQSVQLRGMFGDTTQ
jgi:hypothetical protein